MNQLELCDGCGEPIIAVSQVSQINEGDDLADVEVNDAKD